jgi:hypothetical protein
LVLLAKHLVLLAKHLVLLAKHLVLLIEHGLLHFFDPQNGFNALADLERLESKSKFGEAFYAILIILKGYAGDFRRFWLLSFCNFQELMNLAIIPLHKDLHCLLSIRLQISRRKTL